MKNLFLAIIALSLTFTLNAQRKVKGNGTISKISRNTESYSKITCAGSFDYVLVSGIEGNITIEGEENLLDYIVTKVKNDKLIIKVKDGMTLRTSSKNTIKITIPFQDIEGVSLAGSGDLWNEDVINAPSFEASLAGSGDVVLNINTTSAKGNLAGSGDLTFKGKTDSVDVNVSGSGDFHGFNLEANNTDVAISGSGDAEVVSNQSLKATLAGSGSIEYKGNPEEEDTKAVGSGSIRKK